MTVYTDLVKYRELFGNLFRRDLQAKYKGSFLGVAWTLANPVLLMAIYLLVFSVLWKAVSIDHYGLFLLTGLAPWIFFSSSMQNASRSLLDNASLIRKTRFPRQLVPLSIVATNLVSLTVMLAVLLVLNFALLPRVRGTEWLAIPLVALLVCLVGGLALIVASLDVLYRDVEHLIAALLLPWFFLTPILYTYGTLGAAQRSPDARGAAPLAQLHGAADHRDPRPALLRDDARLEGRALPRRRGRRLARARRLGLQPPRRPARSRAVIRAS